MIIIRVLLDFIFAPAKPAAAKNVNPKSLMDLSVNSDYRVSVHTVA
ncbi:MAG: hypothetical protein NTU53_15105 [Planctomycetota bacterium]|nr:hypothetical protein [Planctomycetota bacterium]